MSLEIFKVIEGFPKYEVSNLGNVRNIKTGRVLKCAETHDGYSRVGLYNEDGKQHLRVHRLVAKAFLANQLNKLYVDHMNSIRNDNRLCNLRFATKKENTQHSKLAKNNTSGVKGVYHVKSTNKWIASISIDGKSIHLGTYKTKEDAREARMEKANEAFGEFTHAIEKN